MNGDGEMSGVNPEMAFDLGQLKKRPNSDIVAGFVPGGEVLGVSMPGGPVQPMPVFTLEWRMENGEVRKAVKIPPPMIMALIAQMSGFMMQVMGGVQVQEGQGEQGQAQEAGAQTNGG